jgi:Flp pilus assembly protein TadD
VRYLHPFVLTVILFTFPSYGADSANISGEIVCDTPVDFNSIQVELQDLANQGPPVDRVNVTFDGRFDIKNVPPGQFLLVVKTPLGDPIYRDVVSVQSHDARLQIKLPSDRKQKPGAGVVSVRELAHKPPKAARKAFDKSITLMEKNDVQGSLKLLQKAVEIDPLFGPAINNLGARYLMTGQFAEAAACFQRAIALDPHSGLAYANLSQTMLYLRNPVEGEKAARRALEIDSSDLKPSYLLGLSLVMQKKFTKEAILNLRRSEHFSPRATLALGLALAATGSTVDARNTLRSALKSSDEPVRIEAQRLLSSLR